MKKVIFAQPINFLSGSAKKRYHVTIQLGTLLIGFWLMSKIYGKDGQYLGGVDIQLASHYRHRHIKGSSATSLLARQLSSWRLRSRCNICIQSVKRCGKPKPILTVEFPKIDNLIKCKNGRGISIFTRRFMRTCVTNKQGFGSGHSCQSRWNPNLSISS